MIVAKFGGSSVKDAKAMLACVEVVKKTPDLGVVIISATYDTTNQLERLFTYLNSKDYQEAEKLWASIIERHRAIAKDLGSFCEKPLEVLFDSLTFKFKELVNKESLDLSHRDLMLSFGEQLSSLLFQLTLKEHFRGDRDVFLVPATAFLKTDSSFGLAKPKPESIKIYAEGLFRKGLEKGDLFVTQGFIGANEKEQTTTLGREGSDYSATLLAQALEASEVHIWTDVDGIYTTDPNIVKEAKALREITYDQATSLATAGAKVLFPKTLAPLKGLGIPLKVGKTSFPQGEGTWIRDKVTIEYPLLGITVKERSDELIITLVGDKVYDIDMDQSEIDRGDIFRSFFQAGGDPQETLRLWYRRYFT